MSQNQQTTDADSNPGQYGLRVLEQPSCLSLILQKIIHGSFKQRQIPNEAGGDGISSWEGLPDSLCVWGGY